MSATTSTASYPVVEYFPAVGDRDFSLRIKRYPNDGSYNAGETWVQLDEVMLTDSGHSWLKMVWDYRVEEDLNDLQCLKDAFGCVRRRMKQTVRSWAQYRYWASLEKGGKRAYYTRYANEWKARIAADAEAWRLSKLIWKELVKL